MQSDNGREFVNVIVHKMLDEFNIKMVNGAPRHSQSQGSVERGNKDIEDLLYTWMSTNKTRCSSINSVHEEHSLQQRNRNESFFGKKPRLGLANLNLDKEVTDEIWTEEPGVIGNSRLLYKFLGISVFCYRAN